MVCTSCQKATECVSCKKSPEGSGSGGLIALLVALGLGTLVAYLMGKKNG